MQFYRSILFISAFLLNSIFCLGQAHQKQPHEIDTTGFNYYASISPNGKFISYIKMAKKDYRIYGNIWLYDVDKDTSYKIIKGANHSKAFDNYPSWAPNSKAIYFSSIGNLYKYELRKGKVEVLYKTDIEKEQETAFAPMVSPDGEKLAFWEINYESNVHYVSYLDLNTRKVIQFQKKKYNPGTEVTFYNPQWGKKGKRIFATYFGPRTKKSLLSTNIKTGKSKKVDEHLRSTYFKVVGDYVYYAKYDTTKVDPQEGYPINLFKTNFNKGSKELISSNTKAVFDVSQSGIVFFGKRDSEKLFYLGSKKEGFTKGFNPSVGNNKLVFERWLEKESESGIQNGLYWISLSEFQFVQ